jgi:hypothetical protein
MLETRINMVLPGIVEEWNYWTDACDPQEFMNLSRAQGHPTIGAEVHLPFGGVKDSGYGHEGGIEGLEVYMNKKFIAQA